MTKQKFTAFVKVQHSGKTNMFALNNVIALADVPLTKEDCLDIMKNYEKYFKQWGKEIEADLDE
jgi:hypothetical protein